LGLKLGTWLDPLWLRKFIAYHILFVLLVMMVMLIIEKIAANNHSAISPWRKARRAGRLPGTLIHDAAAKAPIFLPRQDYHGFSSRYFSAMMG